MSLSVSSLNEAVAAWVCSFRDEALPQPMIESTKLRILDIVGCMLGAADDPDVIGTKNVAAETFPGAQTRSVPFADHTSIAGAALINGTAALVHEFDDSHLEAALHSSSPVIGASLPIADAHDLAGLRLIAAVAIGNELTCRLGLVAPGKFHDNGFHPTGIFGTFGAIYAASRCLSLDQSQTANAIGIGGSLSGALMGSWEDGSSAKSLHAGFSAVAGINATSCAKHGVSGPKGVFDGRFGFFKAHVQENNYEFAFARVMDRLGDDWEALRIAPKAYPCGHYIQPCVDAALALRLQYGIRPEEIVAVLCSIPAHVIPLIAEPVMEKRRPSTSFHGRFSLQHSMAEAMMQGTLDKSSFKVCNLTDRSLNELADKVHAIADPLASDRTQLAASVEIQLKDGRRVGFTVEHMRGMPQNPMTTDDLIRKFRSNIGDLMPDSKTGRIAEIIMSLDRMSSIQPFMAELSW
jgi:2-methylcitrate dehydratase PrpD